MSSKSFISSLILTLSLLTSAAAAQTLPQVQESKEEQQKAQQELERKALAMLDATLESAQTLRLPENRAMVQSNVADLIWTRDEKRARNLFRDSMTAIGDSLNNISAQYHRFDSSYWMLMEMRRQTLQTIARRDPQLALDLLHATRPASSGEDTKSKAGGQDQELALEQGIAYQVALNDPKQALQLAQESLAKGVSYTLISLLMRLQQKDAEAATRLAVDIIKKLQTESTTRNREAGYVAQALLSQVVQPRQGEPVLSAGSAQAPEKIKPLKLDEQAMHDLADVVVTMAMNGSSLDLGYVMNLQPLLPELEKRVPERAIQLRKKIAEANKSMEPEAKEWMRATRLMRDGTPDEVLEAASKAAPETRNGLYMMAAMKFAEAGNSERARQILNDNVNGPERDQLLAQIDRQLMAQAVEQGKMDEAKQLASRLRSKEARATELAYLAVSVSAKGDRKTALQLMTEAQNLVNRQPDNQEQLNALIQITRAYTLIEPARAFEIVEPIIDQANEMLAAAALLEKFGAGRMSGGPGEGLFKKGELLLNPGFISIERIGNQYGKGLAALARADFDHTKALADRFQRNEARILARILIAQSILSDHLVDTGDAPNGIFYGGGRGILIGN
jgi:hypothetical protein